MPLDFVMTLLAKAFASSVAGHREPPRLEITDIDYADAESVVLAACRLDQIGEWARAVELYEYVLQTWPDEHGLYARNCIAEIRKKSDDA